MGVYGYIYLARKNEMQIPVAEQREAIQVYGRSIGLRMDAYFVERNSSLKRPFSERIEGGKLYRTCNPGDVVVVMKVEWVLGSARGALSLVEGLRSRSIALHCIDLKGNISLDEKRRLAVTEGCSGLVRKILAGLAVCENIGRGEQIKAAKRSRKREGKYLGGPVPFGWQVDGGGFLVPKKQEQKIIKVIAKMRKDRWSYRDISKKLKNEFGVQLSHEGVRRVMNNNC